MRLGSYAHVLLRRDGRIEIAVALVACSLVAAVLWPPASLVGGIVRALVPPAGCAGLATTSPLMYACSTSYAALTLGLPMAWVATLYRARTWLVRRVAALRRRVPARAAHFLAPALATAALVIPWAFVHADTGGNVGLVPQWALPAALATAAYGLERYAAAVKGLLAEFLAVRDRMAGPTRAALAVVPPLALALAITAEPRVTAATLKEQVVALTAFACGYLALAPAHGELASVIGSLFRAELPLGLRAALRRALPASGLMLLLLEPSIAYACSAHSSCESVAGYNAAVGIAGGMMALATSALANDVASATMLAVDARSAKVPASYPAYALTATIPWLPAAAALIGIALIFTIVRPTEAGADGARVPGATAVAASVLPSAATASPRAASIPVGVAFAFSGCPPTIEYKLASSYHEATVTPAGSTDTVIDLAGRTVAGEIVFGAFDPDSRATSAPTRRQPFSVVLQRPETMLPPITVGPRSYARILIHTIDGQPAHEVGLGTARVPAC